MEDSPWTSITIGVVGALFVVWMARHQRWTYFFNGLTGRLVISGSRAGSNPANTGTSGSTSSPPGSSQSNPLSWPHQKKAPVPLKNIQYTGGQAFFDYNNQWYRIT